MCGPITLNPMMLLMNTNPKIVTLRCSRKSSFILQDLPESANGLQRMSGWLPRDEIRQDWSSASGILHGMFFSTTRSTGIDASLSQSMIKPGAGAKPGQGKKVAEAFQKATFEVQGYEDSLDTASLGLEQIAKNPRATEREQLIAKVGLHQLDVAQKTNSKEILKGEGFGSKSLLATETLGFIAAGHATTGPIGAVLADLGGRQMDWIRGQSFNTATPEHIRDSNVAGRSMLEAIKELGGDQNAQMIAEDALAAMTDRYTKSESAREAPEARLLRDSQLIYGALDDIKTVTCQGDLQNPKCMAFLNEELPDGTSASMGRPGGGWVEVPSGDGFTLSKTRKPKDWDR